MNATQYQKLARKCAKHIHGLALALDGVVKAEVAGQQHMVKSSVHRAQDCLSDVLDCLESTQDQELLSPLYRMDKALSELTDGQRVAEIERDMQEFQILLVMRQNPAKSFSAQEMVYSGNTR